MLRLYFIPQSTFLVGIAVMIFCLHEFLFSTINGSNSESWVIDGYHSALQKNVWGLSYMKYNYKVKVINYTLMFYRDGHFNWLYYEQNSLRVMHKHKKQLWNYQNSNKP